MSSPEIQEKTPPDDLIKAAETGDADAQTDLGRWYAENLPETPYAQMWFRRAADQGLPRALHNMGVMAVRSEDNELAIDWFRKAVAADWRNSMFPLGGLLEESGDINGALETYNLGIVKGCADSMHAMSRLIIDNEIKGLYENARIWCERATAQGHAGAQMQLAQIYHEGLGVQPDPKQAVSLWLKAARQGHSGAQVWIGVACDMGFVLKEDRVAAMRFLSASAAQDNEAAKVYLPSVERKLTPQERAQFERDPIPFAHLSPVQSAKPPPADILWAAEAGDAESQNELGAWYAQNLPETPYAQMWFKHAADQGDINAYHNLGAAAFNANDMPLAAEWFKKAVAAGLLESFVYLGTILDRNGDIVGATEIFRLGADRNCPDCQCGLGRLAFREKTQESCKRARYWDEKAAAQGNVASQARLGTMYHEGLGVEPNPEQAVHWWQQAARQGHYVAQYMMGVACHKGTGTKKDRLAAMRFLKASAARGNKDAKGHLPKVEAELTPEERSELESEAIAARH